jgi:gas vesicle protein
MTFFRNRVFLEGIAIGAACGIVIGSVIAFTLGESNRENLRKVINKRVPGRDKVPFEYLAQ